MTVNHRAGIRAVVFDGPATALDTRTFPEPKLAPGEVLVRVNRCAICASDLHSWTGRRPTPVPIILGHETVGEVVEVGPEELVSTVDGTAVEVGHRIVWAIYSCCGQCRRCLRGHPQKCLRLFKYGHEAISPTHPLSGGFAEYAHLASGTPLVAVPDTLPDDVACLASCAGATAAAAVRRASAPADGAALIHGAGALGLLAAAHLRDEGAGDIVVIDPNPVRLPLARRFGASETYVAASDVDQGRRFDVAIEMSGAPAATREQIDRLDIGGTCVLVGAVKPTGDVGVQPEHLVRNLITLTGLHNYEPRDLEHSVALMARRRDAYPFDELVGSVQPLGQLDAAFRLAESGRHPRVVVDTQAESPVRASRAPCT